MIPATLLLLGGVVALILFLLPPEERLGTAIRPVLLHGALARAGLWLFLGAAGVGVVHLLTRRPGLAAWTVAAQRTAVLGWIIYILQSMMATYLTWGIAIAWGEPRVEASARILLAALVFLALGSWVGSSRFTSFLNVVLAVVAWVLTRNAMPVRHPADPIGTTESLFYRVGFGVMAALLMLMAIQVARWMRVMPSGGAEPDG